MSARWVRKDDATGKDGLVVRYTWRDRVPTHDEPVLTVSRDGVAIGGTWPTLTCTEIARLLELLVLARQQHAQIVRTGSAFKDMTEKDDRKGVFG